MTTIILLLLGLGGMQLFSLSILGDYLGKVLEETKGRPRFIRARILRGNETIAHEKEMSDFMTEVRQSLRGRAP